jgi:hypothetical protein
MDGAYLAGRTSDGFDQESASDLLVISNVLVVVMCMASFCIGWCNDADKMEYNADEQDANYTSLQEPFANFRQHDDAGQQMADFAGDIERQLSSTILLPGLPQPELGAEESAQSSSEDEGAAPYEQLAGETEGD